MISNLLSLVGRLYSCQAGKTDPQSVARNVMLLTMIVENQSASPKSLDETTALQSIWNIFYHLFLPASDLRKLQDHAKRLASASTSADAWKASNFNLCVAFVSQSTLSILHEYWSLYAKSITTNEQAALNEKFRDAARKIVEEKIGSDFVLNSLRASGAHIFDDIEVMRLTLINYLRTGVAGGNTADQLRLHGALEGCANPMFAHSAAPKGIYAVHWGCEPLVGFHLAEVFDKGLPVSSTIESAVALAKTQFAGWCDAFKSTVEARKVRLLLHCGDAIALCHQIQRENTNEPVLPPTLPLYLAPWTSASLRLDDPDWIHGERLFDVIDTSNISDFLGVLTVLAATVPLLKRAASSTLHTETLMLPFGDVARALEDSLCADVSTMSLMIGLSPLGHLTGEIADSNASETMLLRAQESREEALRYYRMRTMWKAPELGDPRAWSEKRKKIHVPANELCGILVGVLKRMFTHEQKSVHQPANRFQPFDDATIYHALSFVATIRLATQNIDTEWGDCLCRIVEHVNHLRTNILKDTAEEVLLYLSLCGCVRPSRALPAVPNVTDADEQTFAALHIGAGVSHTFSHLVLSVPRECIAIMVDHHLSLGNPGAYISIKDTVTGSNDQFRAVQCFFGQLERDPNHAHVYQVTRDRAGWIGLSDLIVTCIVPTSQQNRRSKGTNVSLSINRTQLTSELETILGPDLTLFECESTETERLLFFKGPPEETVYRDTCGKTPADETDDGNSISGIVGIANQRSNLEALCLHESITNNPGQAKDLAAGAAVSITQSSPCAMRLSIGTTGLRYLVYPFPIDGKALLQSNASPDPLPVVSGFKTSKRLCACA